MELEIIFCVDCECEIEITRMQRRTLRCEDCKVTRQTKLSEKTERKRRAARKNKKGARCSCGCNRLKDPELRMLSRYCYQRYSGRFENEDTSLVYDDYKGGQGGER